MEPVVDGALAAFRRLLVEASHGGQAKVDAIVALSQRTVHVATWMPTHDGFRTVINADGQSALPVFTGLDELRRAAQRFGWTDPSGAVASQEVGARQALRYVLSQDLSFVVVDIASAHAMEIDRAEVEPLLGSMGKRDSTGPFAAVGRISSSMLEAVESQQGSARPSSSPRIVRSGSVPSLTVAATPRDDSTLEIALPTARATVEEARKFGETPRTGEIALPAGGIVAARAAAGMAGGVAQAAPSAASAPPSATFGSGSSVRIEVLADPPDDDLLAALADVLRGYPEVEWAALFGAARGPAPMQPTVGLRVDTAYRARVNEIMAAIRESGDDAGAALDVLLLDDAQLMRQARAEALVFFPWVRKTRV